jgi:hypothetical protein
MDPGTWRDYRTHGTKRLIPEFGDQRLDEIATADVREWLAEASEADVYKPKTLNNALGIFVVCLNQATNDRLLQTNPAAGVKRLPLGHIERDYLRIHEIDLYLSCCSTAYRPLAELLVSCGLRISEALGLTWVRAASLSNSTSSWGAFATGIDIGSRPPRSRPPSLASVARPPNGTAHARTGPAWPAATCRHGVWDNVVPHSRQNRVREPLSFPLGRRGRWRS